MNSNDLQNDLQNDLDSLFFLPSSSSNLGASKSTFEKLSALGYKCEARLSLLYYKMNQGQHDYMRLHKDLTDVLQQKVNSPQNLQKSLLWIKSARFTPTSPVRSELREATLSEKEFRTLKTYLSGNQWLLKAHEKWDRGKNLATKVNHWNQQGLHQKLKSRIRSFSKSSGDSAKSAACISCARSRIFPRSRPPPWRS